MKVVLACYGSRGDVEPAAAIGRELLHRGHEVRMAVAPELVGFVEAAGLAAVACGPDLQSFVDAQRGFQNGTDALRNFWKIQDQIRLKREAREFHTQCWRQTSATLTPLAAGADLLVTGLTYEEVAANVAEYHDIPLATLHHYPIRPNGQLPSFLPSPLVRPAMTLNEWLLYWQVLKRVEDTQRRELRLPKAKVPSPRRIAKRGSLEIQAYDEICFPGLAAEWAKWDGQRPFVGAVALDLTTDADAGVASWIAAGTPPICFSLGSTPVESPADTVEMISAACAQLGERALICAGGTDVRGVPHFDHVKLVDTVNYAVTFRACRAIVHHGGSGTTGASLRAGVPTMILWTWPDQAIWGAQLDRLKVGMAQRFSNTTRESLVAGLRQILSPQYGIHAREIAAQMTKPAESTRRAADLLETFARARRAG
ncbi:glycosyltransferase [Mycobacterium sp. 4858]|uniref:glycosyltransferase n=1 Tax=Mycobacterium sp. 4858 TaxID=2057185 RepID=UPI000C85B583|nr:glycosyltransferase [Mycobacterium sp. 4858]